MANNDNLFNAAIVGENPDTAFLVEGNRLHAVEKSIADLRKDKSSPQLVIPMIRNALKALIVFAAGKVENHFLEVDWKAFTDKSNEQALLVLKIGQIYSHLPHHDHNELSSMIHHKAAKR